MIINPMNISTGKFHAKVNHYSVLGLEEGDVRTVLITREMLL